MCEFTHSVELAFYIKIIMLCVKRLLLCDRGRAGFEIPTCHDEGHQSKIISNNFQNVIFYFRSEEKRIIARNIPAWFLYTVIVRVRRLIIY